MNYNSQVKEDHYQNKYDSLERFVSYYNQKNLIIRIIEEKFDLLHVTKILEIGKGSGFLSRYLDSNGIKIKTLDNTAELEPDYIGSITNAEQLPKELFDIVCCFEVLEHIKFSDVDASLKNLATLSASYVVISVPQLRYYVSFWLKIPLFRGRGFTIFIPIPVKHKFDGEHYWELRKRNYSLGKFRSMLEKYFSIEREFTHPLNPYHRFYVLKK